MTRMAVTTGTGLIVLMVTDILECFPTLYFAGSDSGGMTSCSVPGMVSRKKQLLPWLEHILSQRRSLP